MEDKAVRHLAIQVVVVSILIGCILFYLPSFSSYVDAKMTELRKMYAAFKDREEMTALELLTYNTEIEESESGKKLDEEIRMYLPFDVTKDQVEITFNPVKKRIDFVVPDSKMSDLDKHPIVGSSKYIADMSVWEEEDGLHVTFWTDVVVEPRLTGDKDYCYIKFYKPQELYDYVIVIDAGHGGSQPGAVKSGYEEKDINLEIVLRMKEILDTMDNVRVYYTRLTDVNVELQERATLARESEANLFISVHQNSIPYGAADTHGVQVFYDINAEDSPTNSYALAMICKEEIIKATGCNDKGLRDNNNLHIVRESKVPVALVECGFMSNAEELNNLISGEYQQKLAEALCNAIVRALEGGF